MSSDKKYIKGLVLLSWSLILTTLLAQEREDIRSEVSVPFSMEGVSLQSTSKPANDHFLVFPATLSLYSHGDPTVQEQYMLELVNRTRENPLDEAARLGIDINQGLPEGTLDGEARPPLAFNPFLIDSSRAHSQWMLDNDIFSHVGVDDSAPFDRMVASGYTFSGSYAAAENIAWAGTGNTNDPIDINSFTSLLHDNLFKSPGHRINILSGLVNEIGIGIKNGLFTAGTPPNRIVYNALMGTQNFALSGASEAPFILGVVYDDLDLDGFYTPGEGISGVTVSVSGGEYYAVTTTSGGYALPYVGTGWTEVYFQSEAPLQNRTFLVNFTGENLHLNYSVGEPEPEPPQITEQPLDVSATIGQSALFSVFATGSDPICYQWFKDSIALLDATNSIYQIEEVAPSDAGEYWVQLSNSGGQITSQIALLTIHIPTLYVRADSLSRPYNTPNPPLTYTITTEEGFAMSPEGSPILETAATQDSPIGTYPILVSQGTLDPTYTYIFEDGTLTITDNTEPTIPIILTHPSDSTVPVGESLFFSTFATGSEPLFYQWLKNGEPIAGATDSFFTIFEVLPADAGVYQVLVYNEAGQMLSQEAKLTPLPLTYRVVAHAITRTVGFDNPDLTYSITNEQSSPNNYIPPGTPSLETTADLESGVGVYPIKISLGSLDPFHNYIFEDGSLTVIPPSVGFYYSHGQPTAQEQYMLELINCARNNPVDEALRLGMDPTTELPSGCTNGSPIPPLAFNDALLQSAGGHSTWLLEEHQWSFTGENGSTPAQRMADAGYPFVDNLGWTCGESIGLYSPLNTPALDAQKLYEGFFQQSSSFRDNILEPIFEEIGVGLTSGNFNYFAPDTPSLIATIDFASSGASLSPYVTGVVYDDLNNNKVYDLGEGVAEIIVYLEGSFYYTVTSSSGGYALPYYDLGESRSNLVFEGTTLSQPRVFNIPLPGDNVKVNIRTSDPYPDEPQEATLSWSQNGNSLTLSFTGKLETSTDLLTWTELMVNSPYSVPIANEEKRFYRAVN
jgi:uncharacterized protein YkwD